MKLNTKKQLCLVAVKLLHMTNVISICLIQSCCLAIRLMEILLGLELANCHSALHGKSTPASVPT